MSDNRQQSASEAPPSSVESGSRPQSLRTAWVALSGLSAVFLLEMLDNSVLNVALPTIGRELEASTTALQWVTSSYAVVFGGLMIELSALADRVGRRKVMLVGLVLLGLASLTTAFVSTAEQLIAVRVVMGFAAAMTTPGSMALAFRLFADDQLRVRAMTLISTVGLVGLAVGPTAGGLVLSFAPWQTLLLVNVLIAAVAIRCIRAGVPADRPDELHAGPIDVGGALLGTTTIVLALLAPTLFVEQGARSWLPWTATTGTAVAAVLFVLRQRAAAYPLLDLALLARPLVAAGMRIVGVVAGNNVMRGLPSDRTTIGAALIGQRAHHRRRSRPERHDHRRDLHRQPRRQRLDPRADRTVPRGHHSRRDRPDRHRRTARPVGNPPRPRLSDPPFSQ